MANAYDSSVFTGKFSNKHDYIVIWAKFLILVKVNKKHWETVIFHFRSKTQIASKHGAKCIRFNVNVSSMFMAF